MAGHRPKHSSQQIAHSARPQVDRFPLGRTSERVPCTISRRRVLRRKDLDLQLPLPQEIDLTPHPDVRLPRELRDKIPDSRTRTAHLSCASPPSEGFGQSQFHLPLRQRTRGQSGTLTRSRRRPHERSAETSVRDASPKRVRVRIRLECKHSLPLQCTSGASCPSTEGAPLP